MSAKARTFSKGFRNIYRENKRIRRKIKKNKNE
jgi:hypothetical protein